MGTARHEVHPASEATCGLIEPPVGSTDSDEPHGNVSLPAPFTVKCTRSWPYLVVGGIVLVAFWCANTPVLSWHSRVPQQLWIARNRTTGGDTNHTANATTAAATTMAATTTAATTTAATTTAATTTAATTTAAAAAMATPPPPPEAKDNNVYCWLVTPSSGKEADLLRAHYAKARNVFSCKSWSIFTDTDKLVPVSEVTNIGPVNSTSALWNLLNTDVFMRAWDAMIADGRYKRHPWTLKVEAATVFFPERLDAHVHGLSPDHPWFLKSDGMLQAPIEVFSRAAVDLYAAQGRQKCSNKGAKAGQEDSFFDYCMHTLGVTPKADEHHLMDCGDPDRCSDRDFLAFHPFKTSALYDDCAEAARKSEEEPAEAKPLTGFCCTWGTDCYSCPKGNRPNRSTYCGQNPERCSSCGDRATWCQPPRAPVKCGNRRVLTLYHQTSSHFCELILASNFKVGKVGWCGGGIYFAMDAQATNQKCIGPSSNTGCILQVRVDVGRTWVKGKKCNRSLLGKDVIARGYDSVSFDPSDGQEYAIYNNSHVLSIRRYGWWLPDAQVHAAYWEVPGR